MAALLTAIIMSERQAALKAEEDMNSDRIHRSSAGPERATFTLRLLTAANAALYLVAAVLHLGVKIPLGLMTLGFPQPIPQATVAEALIGGVLAVAAGALFVRAHAARRMAWGTYYFALVGTLFGLTIVFLRGLGGPNLGVHFVMMAGLASGFVLLFAAWRPLQRPS